MVDLRLFYHLLQAFTPRNPLDHGGRCRSAAAGGARSALQRYAGRRGIPSVRLTEVFRQAETSLIVANAHRINRGEFPKLNSPQRDFFLIEEKETANLPGLIVD